MLWRRNLNICLCAAIVAALSACGGGSSEGDGAEAGGDRDSARIYVAELPRSQPPPITVTLRLRRDGVARIIYQVGGARNFRDERGRWTELEGQVVLSFAGSEHQEGPLPSPLSLRVEGSELVAPQGSLAAAEIRFFPFQK